jgi:hypothetical protein
LAPDEAISSFPHKIEIATLPEFTLSDKRLLRLRLAMTKAKGSLAMTEWGFWDTLYLSNEGWEFSRISFWVNVSYRTIQRWFCKYKIEGLDGFLKRHK